MRGRVFVCAEVQPEEPANHGGADPERCWQSARCSGISRVAWTPGSSPSHARREVLWLNSGFCGRTVIHEMRLKMIPFCRALLAVQKMFGFFHMLKLQNISSRYNNSQPLLPKLLVEEKFCKHPGGWKELLQTAKLQWKWRKGFSRFLRLLPCEIRKCVASKHLSKQKPDVLESSKPPTELSSKLSSMPGHPIWCCCLTAVVDWPLHSCRLNITILCEVILYFIVLVFFLFSVGCFHSKKQMSWVDTRSLCQALWVLQLSGLAVYTSPFTALGAVAVTSLLELCQQLIFVSFLIVFEIKRHVCGGFVYSALKGNILLCCWVFWWILGEWEIILKLGNYFYKILKHNISTSLSCCTPHPPTWWHWYGFTEDTAVAESQLFSEKRFWQNPLLTLYTWGFIH